MADTNNHAVRIVDLADGHHQHPRAEGDRSSSHPRRRRPTIFGEVIEVAASVNPRPGAVVLNIELPPDHKVNEAAPSSAEFSATGGVADFGDAGTVSLTGDHLPGLDSGRVHRRATGTITADLTVIYCHKDAESLCFIQQLRFLVDVRVSPEISADSVALNYQIVLPDL